MDALNEEALAAHLSADERKLRGAFFTPAWLVEKVLDDVAPFVPRGRFSIIDPACGAGAFLAAAAKRWPRADVFGVELNEASARICRERVPRATVRVGDALLDDLLPPRHGFELWIGNPPWNGTSPLLTRPTAWATACSWLPDGVTLQKGTSLREDYVFFLLKASLRLADTRGALAFITSATLLDAWAHEPVRKALSSRLTLREVEVLPSGTFAGTKVKSCITVWTSPRAGEARSFKPVSKAAQTLNAKWKKRGATIDELVPVHFAGLKTRFDELLVDEDRSRLMKRLRAFLRGRDTGLEGFDTKLTALRAHARGAKFDEKNVRRFLHPNGARAWCYVDRRLIPRGDHRFRGEFDPHASNLKLVFNVRELPLHAQVLDEAGCVTMYRHTRFAPEFVPRALVERHTATHFDADDLVPNLTRRGRELGGVRDVFEHIASHINSREFQNVWAPAFGTTELPLVGL
ncbi:MAG: SAM-dependent methyltransferase [Archangium gephyra]|uniref:site-specific DNA-methyltransferase (adenine-specific) n=1 Tax=Archangium gephyra TaxID=48 RepID=A0A2W5V9U6_9BACT|nr:MAG: SAM-dependent methyltransferase [Archangium gephyra]